MKKALYITALILVLAACGGGHSETIPPDHGVRHAGSGQWEGVDLNVVDGDPLTYLKSYTDPRREVGASGWIRAYFPEYSGPPPLAVYLHITHETLVDSRDYVALNGEALDRSGNRTTQIVYLGTSVPRVAEIDFTYRNDRSGGPADPHVTVCEMSLEVVTDAGCQ